MADQGLRSLLKQDVRRSLWIVPEWPQPNAAMPHGVDFSR